MTDPQTSPKNAIVALIERWPRALDLATDIGLPDDEQSATTVRAWKLRGSIPPAYWSRVVAAAASRGFADITLEELARLAALRAGLAPEAA